METGSFENKDAVLREAVEALERLQNGVFGTTPEKGELAETWHHRCLGSSRQNPRKPAV